MSSLEESLEVGGRVAEAEMFAHKTALVLGAGGMGMTMAYGLLRRGAAVVLTDGLPRQATLLAKRLNCRSIDWSLRHTVTADLLLNCTPVGMHPNVDESPYDKHYLRPRCSSSTRSTTPRTRS